MAGIKVNLVVMVMAIMLASMQFHGTVAQTTHVVGDALGWTIPSAGASDYSTWASRQTFTVGDVLLFNFTAGHTVAEVAEAAYGPCTTTTLMSIYTSGPARITLNAAGNHYYICTVGTHCQLGQKLSINVGSGASATPAPAPGTPAPVSPPTTTPTPSPTPSTTIPPPPTSSPSPSGIPTPSPSGSTTPSPSGSTTPSPSGSTTPSPSGSTSPPPPADSFAPSFTAAVPITFLAMTLAFFY